jgi:acetyltransferase-like isoleucine patch superfamily enzyme
MSAFWRIRRLWHSLAQNYYRILFVRHCQAVGCDLLVKGPFRVRNTGRIEVGEACIIDSSKERTIRLDVGNRAIFKIGDGVYLNEGVQIVCNIAVTIGNHCLIASDVAILDDDGHPVDWRERHNHWPKSPEDRLGAPIVIEDNAWIGTRAIILKGVHIGTGAVIGAGAVVTHDVPPFTVAAGVPARVIKKI